MCQNLWRIHSPIICVLLFIINIWKSHCVGEWWLFWNFLSFGPFAPLLKTVHSDGPLHSIARSVISLILDFISLFLQCHEFLLTRFCEIDLSVDNHIPKDALSTDNHWLWKLFVRTRSLTLKTICQQTITWNYANTQTWSVNTRSHETMITLKHDLSTDDPMKKTKKRSNQCTLGPSSRNINFNTFWSFKSETSHTFWPLIANYYYRYTFKCQNG